MENYDVVKHVVVDTLEGPRFFIEYYKEGKFINREEY